MVAEALYTFPEKVQWVCPLDSCKQIWEISDVDSETGHNSDEESDSSIVKTPRW